MDKVYDPQKLEQHWYQYWEDQGFFTPQNAKQAYCIMIPPPNVTGTLHMGHAFQHTLMDILIRYHRMLGDNTHWQAGTDHAGIATQMVVERQLNLKNISRLELGREEFIKHVWDWKKQSGDTITRQMRRLGDSPDWSQERFTMDEGLSKAVTEVFVRLYEEKLIYRGKRLVNWDPVLHTAVSDLEVVSTEENGHLWHIRYPLIDSDDYLTVATTRPETMLGDTAVAVNPGDERYRGFIGRSIQLPLCDRTIPVIADEYVEMEFGSGCVKITPAHDFNDYMIGQRHSLEMINIFTIDAKLNENAPQALQGMDRFDARKQILEDLKSKGLLEKTETHKLMVPRGDRSNAVIEPFLTDQWFVKAKPLAEPAIKAVENGKICFTPSNWSKTYFNWMHNIEDWCISRQLWWGHRIPAWYDQHGNIYVGRNINEIKEKYNLNDIDSLKQDQDVLDTWFSSALWPFSTLGWPEETPALKEYYPTNVLVTGFDIIFFWVARMIMMGLKFMDDVPFHEIYITGLIRDEQGQKMSKAKGNILDPIDLIDGIELDSLIKKRTTGLMQPQMAAKIEKTTRDQYPDGIPAFGTDALRFTLASLASTGRNINFDLKRMEGYRNFCNKLWNAARFVLMNVKDQKLDLDKQNHEYSLADKWVVSELQTLETNIQKHINNYRFDLAAQAIYEFIWDEYCDWYIELSKPILQSDNSKQHAINGTRYTLVHVLETILRIAHPFIPFITEEIWQQISLFAGKQDKTIMMQPYPLPDDAKIDQAAVEEIRWLKAFIMGVRRIRSESNIAPGKLLPVMIQKGNAEDRKLAERNEQYLKTLGKLESISYLDEKENQSDSAMAAVGDMKILVPLSGLIDPQAEIKRCENELNKKQQEYERIDNKLNNKQFIEKAPQNIVEKERKKLEEFGVIINNLLEQIEKLKQL